MWGAWAGFYDVDVMDILDEAARGQRLVWCDVESTGLTAADLLLEIAAVVTEPDLSVVGEPVSIVLETDIYAALRLMPPVVHEMHTASGLLEACAQATATVRDAEAAILDYVRRWVGPRASPLCGSTIFFDRNMIARVLPELNAYLHYRHIDVSTVKELTRRWRPDVYAMLPPNEGGHRALPDILASIKEIGFYREHVFRVNAAAVALG